MYLSRLVVDADFVLPITTGRCGDLDRQHDLFGFFPSFSDSASRLRSMSLPNAIEPDATDPHEPAWALGAQLILCVTATRTGEAANVIAGTPIAIRKHLQESRFSSSQESPTSLIVATLDGNQQQQTWQNNCQSRSDCCATGRARWHDRIVEQHCRSTHELPAQHHE